MIASSQARFVTPPKPQVATPGKRLQEDKKGNLGRNLLYPLKLTGKATKLKGRLARKVQFLKKKRRSRHRIFLDGPHRPVIFIPPMPCTETCCVGSPAQYKSLRMVGSHDPTVVNRQESHILRVWHWCGPATLIGRAVVSYGGTYAWTFCCCFTGRLGHLCHSR